MAKTIDEDEVVETKPAAKNSKEVSLSDVRDYLTNNAFKSKSRKLQKAMLSAAGAVSDVVSLIEEMKKS